MTREIEVYNLGGLPTATVDDFLELEVYANVHPPACLFNSSGGGIFTGSN